ncbi:MAG: Succinate--CoA ligase [ADP-forming] subunit beta [Candidatus Scalindua arabica]|uniref:Succinate--CoA ligase [ADP-forming] subunit beta n=1 Tax=Candidatus Scalindua arabica TaxID=1127984 RepID=A0A941W410_9BACT|nr:Succinate--CoA ligase [ADP-forming] subunit beta [Candidatus Scalindua arabica]
MKLYEYQAQKILHKYNVNVTRGEVVTNADEAAEIYNQLGAKKCVIKAQILAGGRGKGGGVKIVETLDEVKDYTSGIIGSRLVTVQTGKEGIEVKKVLIAEAIDIKKELYLAISIDRNTSKITIISSTEGGTEIEEVASKTPQKILKEQIDPMSGIQDSQARQIALNLNLTGPLLTKASNLLINLFKVFVENDCSLLEINPLILTPDEEIFALDIKMDIDDNALFRHKEFQEIDNVSEDKSAEKMASEAGLSYIGLEGNIGCLVNGAGLAMATMDIIKLHGGTPANFLDVGGDAPVERVTTAFEIIFTDSKVEGVLVNIFGGIMKCDVIAEGIIHAIEKVNIKVPLVVRLEGTNVEIARKILDNPDLHIIFADSMKDASEKIIKAVNDRK